MKKNTGIKINENKIQKKINHIFPSINIDTILKDKKKRKDRILFFYYFFAIFILSLGILFSL